MSSKIKCIDINCLLHTLLFNQHHTEKTEPKRRVCCLGTPCNNLSQPVIQTRTGTGHLVHFHLCQEPIQDAPAAARCRFTPQLPSEWLCTVRCCQPHLGGFYTPASKINSIGPVITVYKPPTSTWQKHKA